MILSPSSMTLKVENQPPKIFGSASFRASRKAFHTTWIKTVPPLNFISNWLAYWSSPSRFEKIIHPLLHQLPLHYKTKTLIPAIVALANKAQSEENCKVINTVLMEYMKAEEAGVRLSAVQTQKGLFEEVSSEWLKVLPPMVPVISELMEDEHEGVVEGTHELIATIERVGGISMQKLLT